MIRRQSSRRGGFTLLEVLLASAIATLLLAGIYAAFDVVLLQTQVARDEAAQADLARAVTNRLSLDLSAALGAMPPRSGGGVNSTTTASTTTGTSGTTTTSGTTSTTSSTTTTSSSSSSGSTTSTEVTDTTDPDSTPVSSDLPLQAGVIGSTQQLSLFSSRVPTWLTDKSAATDPTAVLPADLRRVTYYLGSNGGLCRQERPWVTADGVRTSADPDRTTESDDLIAPEVQDFACEYLDGGTWQSSWDGSQATTDGTSVLGPPRAIRVTLTFASGKRVQQVFAVRAANGLFQSATGSGTTSSGTTTSGTTTGGTTP